MQTSKWLGLVDRNAKELRALIGRYHPAAKEKLLGADMQALPITAIGPESVCEMIRQEIAAKPQEPPVERFDKARAQRDCATLARLLNEAWLGVPESTSCWLIPGFPVLCDLCEDLPEDLNSEVA